MELIKVKDDNAVLDVNVASQLASFEKKVKEIKAKEDEIKQAILKEMEEKNISKVITDEMTITYVAPTYKETFDTKQLRADNPDLYDSYIKLSNVKSSIRIKLQ